VSLNDVRRVEKLIM